MVIHEFPDSRLNGGEIIVRVADYIVKRLMEYGVQHVFMIPGGGAMHLNDAVGRSGIEYICNHHEQACSIAAEGYSRTSGKLGVVFVTSGPGGTNTITGVTGQWTDSVPVLYVSGQIKQETSIESCRDIQLRQLGDQEINIVDIVRPITKFAAIIKDPKETKMLLDKAIYVATHGRPGPVWLDVPLNIQGAPINEHELIECDESEAKLDEGMRTSPENVSEVINILKKSERPVFIAGHGIRVANAQKVFFEVIEKLRVPVVSTFNGFDLIPSDHELFIGRIGTIGDRAGNFALQNADVVLSLGSRNNIRQISYNWASFARAAKKIIIDIDPAELLKPTIKPDLPIQSDARVFLESLGEALIATNLPDWGDWISWCLERKRKYPIVLPEYSEPRGHVNPYHFMKVLTETMDENSTLVAGNGSACVCMFQAGIVKNGQRMFWNSGCATMGYDLPAAIGACIASDKKNIICIAGDGSLQMNIQELQTVYHHKLPIKIFVLNNDGYISMRQTQEIFFQGRFVGCDRSSGISFPNILRIARAYGLPAEKISSHNNLCDHIHRVLRMDGPVVCEVILDRDYQFLPKLSSERKPDGRIISKPLEDMYPFLNREELKQNMMISEWKEE